MPVWHGSWAGRSTERNTDCDDSKQLATGCRGTL